MFIPQPTKDKANENSNTNENLAQTLERTIARPEIVNSDEFKDLLYVFTPKNFDYKIEDLTRFNSKPRRKVGSPVFIDTESFCDYINKHGEEGKTTTYCMYDRRSLNDPNNNISFLTVINDHGALPYDQDWQDYTVKYDPSISIEAERWLNNDRKQMSQVEFAAFIEDNCGDIIAADYNGKKTPSGAEMLATAIKFESNVNSRFKSALRSQSGAVEFTFVENEDEGQVAKMEAHRNFVINIPIHNRISNEKKYNINAKLCYRVREGSLTLWYELTRPDIAFVSAIADIVEEIKTKTAPYPVLFGKPNDE